jgi:hypothetical protein
MLKHITSSRSDHCLIFLDLEQEHSARTASHISRYEIMWEHEESVSGRSNKPEKLQEDPFRTSETLQAIYIK